MKPIIAITIGDINGIGPEVALKSLKRKSLNFIPLLVGPLEIWEKYSQLHKLNLKFLPFRSVKDISEKYINVFDLYYTPKINLGKITGEAGFLSTLSIFIATNLCLNKIASALVTSPISKESLHIAGFKYDGHTEMLAKFTNSKNICMMLLCKSLKVGLVTTHIPVSEIQNKITQKIILEKISVMNKSLQNDFKIKSPKIAVLGLNPHAGDGGILGIEENTVIKPALEKANKLNYYIEGPFAADGFFARYKPSQYDAVLAMYHDQGLIPLKIFAKECGINYTLGLKIIRTSPDHGTAFNIAGKNLASEKSFSAALELAVELSKNR